MLLHHSNDLQTRNRVNIQSNSFIGMGYFIYNILLLLGSPIILGMLLVKKRCRPGLTQRFGNISHRDDLSQSPLLWIHAVSLGEVVTIVPLVKALKKQFPQWTIVVSTITETGREGRTHTFGKYCRSLLSASGFPLGGRDLCQKTSPHRLCFRRNRIMAESFEKFCPPSRPDHSYKWSPLFSIFLGAIA